ncbi:hypothetical protein C8R44DRAFT_203205 [Mycena epipterygia]|nr:hypothetical protein C8R44DRAFT_203205 [Mycena epipterygia]
MVNRHPMLGPIPLDYLAPMFGMLSRCPQLEDLCIAIEMRGNRTDIGQFLADRQWPTLKQFIIEGDLTFTSPVIATAFLARHPSLETLSLPEHLDLPTLPHLRWLFMPDFVNDAPMVAPPTLPRLEYAAITHAYWQPHMDVAEVVDKLHAFPALCGVSASLDTPTTLQTLAHELPKLERLVLCRSPWNADRMRGEENRMPSPECLATLTSFAHLTHLDTSAAIQSIADASGDTDPTLNSLLRALAAMPKLQYVDVDMIHPDAFRPVLTWFSILRDAQGAYAGRRQTRDLRRRLG